MIHLHDLDGCAPTPLAHYLKALGVLRLVAEQADPQARGWWQGERFRLATALDRGQFQRFFLEEYEPSPLIAPWNKGSGFYNNDPAPKPLLASTAKRFQRMRDGLHAGQALLGEQIKADDQVRSIKNESKGRELGAAQRTALRNSAEYKKRLADAERDFKSLKENLISNCRLAWRGPHREWMDAAMVLDDKGIPRFPALLGTGGNDGRLDFTNNFMQRLAEVFDLTDPAGAPSAMASNWIAGALWQATTSGYQSGASVGQYLPGTAGGANNSNGSMADSQLNPFDFLLMLEGAVLFNAHATRRFGGTSASRAAAPFAISAQGAGYASAGESDEGARGEQWMPLWSQPLTLIELRRLLAEGRAQIGARAVREPLDLAKAVARLGVARGIDGFQRYGYIKRNGDANFVVPLGRFYVPDHSSPLLSCLDDLDAWLPRLRREARTAGSARLKQAERKLTESLFAVTQHCGDGLRWQTVLLALTEVESVQVTGSGHAAGPIPALRPDWVRAASQGNANTPELRLALAFALQQWRRDKSNGSKPIRPDTVRRHWLPLKGSRYHVNAEGRLQVEPGVVMSGRSVESDAVAVLGRRLVEASQQGEHRLPLTAGLDVSAGPDDLSAALDGEIDLDRTLALARALMALDKGQWQRAPVRIERGRAGEWPDDAWMAIRLALLPWPLDQREIGADPAILRRLAAGDASGAVTLALQRLRAKGIGSTIRIAGVDAATARRWAAALAFPITERTALGFLKRIDPPTTKTNGESQA